MAAPLEARDCEVLEQLHDSHAALKRQSAVPKRWTGGLRRQMWSRSIKGSNTIEGYNVSDAQALAIVNDLSLTESQSLDVRAVTAYKHAMDFVLAQIDDSDFSWNTTVVKAMHHSMLAYDFDKRPGLYRTSAVYVLDEATGETVYEGADALKVASTVAELVGGLAHDAESHPYVSAAMAHLNLVLIHPFLDGNGRMSRALQTLVLGRSRLADPEHLSIEEWLGSNTSDYYAALQKTGQGRWAPHDDTLLWLRFNMRAHVIQVESVKRDIKLANDLWSNIEESLMAKQLSDRNAESLQQVAYGLELRRSDHMKMAEVDERTATRDFQALVQAGFLVQQGSTRGSFYTAGPVMAEMVAKHRHSSKRTVADPYPELRSQLYA